MEYLSRQTGTCSYVCAAKSLGLQDNYWPTDAALSKRNSWWSKKSLDSSSDFNTLLEEPPADEMNLDGREPADFDYGRDPISELYGCYTTTCVPEFVHCAQRSKTHSSTLTHLGLTDRSHLTFSQCRRNHKLCALNCGVSATKSTYGV
ncbi:hypothetical protein ElyMa_000037100 [Elysia marginata]|uniref:Uncharacterized protein n=1 Tax=Elysia marginata TaxID=1093978 RepID=A0AAV4EDR1_9GAST|nr:hypothetical protein ElyMa_000037100 [Elysia marginata]